uniref:Uncharacterized protein n=1 Tax=Leersia perrieri TaxID=77586 RepID=A0A0D9VAX8_9ORYZ
MAEAAAAALLWPSVGVGEDRPAETKRLFYSSSSTHRLCNLRFLYCTSSVCVASFKNDDDGDDALLRSSSTN